GFCPSGPRCPSRSEQLERTDLLAALSGPGDLWCTGGTEYTGGGEARIIRPRRYGRCPGRRCLTSAAPNSRASQLRLRHGNSAKIVGKKGLAVDRVHHDPPDPPPSPDPPRKIG